MRRYGLKSYALCCLLQLLVLPERNAAQAQTAEVVDRVTAEVTEHMNLYYRLFSERNMEALPDQVFSIPWMTVGNRGINVLSTRDEALVSWQGSLIGLLQNGWGRSEYTVEHVCVLNEASAIVSGYNTRYAEDGSEMSVGAVVYILARAESGWQIVAYTSVEPEKSVAC